MHFSLDFKYRDFSRFPNSFFNKIYQTQSFQFFIIENFVVKFSINKIMHIHRYFIYLIALRIYFPYCYRGGFFIRIAFIVSGPGSERNRTRENHWKWGNGRRFAQCWPPAVDNCQIHRNAVVCLSNLCRGRILSKLCKN